jgi:hypothetical protein
MPYNTMFDHVVLMVAKTETRRKASELLAMAAIGMLFLFIADTVVKFLPLNEIERGRTEGLSAILLFITSFVVGFKEKTRVTTVLLIVSGSLLLVFVTLATVAQLMVLYWALPTLFILVNVLPGLITLGLGIFLLLRKRW